MIDWQQAGWRREEIHPKERRREEREREREESLPSFSFNFRVCSFAWSLSGGHRVKHYLVSDSKVTTSTTNFRHSTTTRAMILVIL